MSEKMDPYEELYNELKELGDIGGVIARETGDKGVITAHRWTVLKLIFLKRYIRDVYTPIVGNYYPCMVFIDLLAGTGLNKYESSNFFIPGSTLIAWSCAQYPFDKILAVGYDRSQKNPHYNSLHRRLVRFISPKSRLKLIKGDVNEKIDEIINELKEMKEHCGGIHYLAFVDPNCHEVHFDTIRKLINLEEHGIYGDLIILLQARLIARLIGSYIKDPGKGKSAELDKFFGTKEWRNFTSEIEKNVIDLYKRKLEELKQRPIIEILDINLMRENIHYYLLYVTRRTRRGSPYTKAVELIKNFVKIVDKQDMVDKAIRRALGIETPLTLM